MSQHSTDEQGRAAGPPRGTPAVPRRSGARAIALACAALVAGLMATAAGGRAARAAEVSGTVRNVAGSPLAQMEVTLWRDLGNKRYEVVYTAGTDVNGYYAVSNVDAGDYLLHARMAPGVSGDYGDRWYDVEEPNGNGYIEADADVVSLAADDTRIGLDFTLEVVGGLDGSVTSGGSPIAGMQVRVEQAGDTRIHHNDTSQAAPHLGQFFMRGLPPSADYRILVHDPLGGLATAIATGPFTVTPGVNGSAGTIAMQSRAADPYEPNNSPDQAGAMSVDSDGLHQDPPVAWQTSGSYLAPRGSDVDWHCLQAQAEDRLLITVLTTLDPGGINRENPWVDPVVGLFTGDGSTLLAIDDDSGPGQRESFIDSGPILQAGPLCIAVTTFGDTTFTGVGQQSAGAYTLRVEMGNRRPWLTVSHVGAPVPVPPDALSMEEDQTLVLDVAFGDPDHDDLAVAFTDVDALGNDRSPEATFDMGDGEATFTWTAGETDAEGDPYALTFTASDGEFTAEADVVLEVVAVNQPPTTPVLLQPADASIVRASEATLVVQNSTDPDGDPLSYEFELYTQASQGEPAQDGVVDEDPSGQTSFTSDTLDDNSVVRWRARAYDGHPLNGYSPWSDFRTFLIDSSNGPPSPPVLVKPENGEEVPLRTPTFSVENSVDAEGDAIFITFEVARDADFTDIVRQSDPVPQQALGSTTAWTIDVPLDWGGLYWAHAWAVDDQGARSETSNVATFTVRENSPAGTPGLGDPLGTQCQGYVYPDGPPQAFVVNNVTDPEGDPITFELEIYDADAGPSDPPLVSESVPEDTTGSVTVITIEDGHLARGGHYRIRVRAYDGFHYTDWSECDFSVGEEPPPAVELSILAPEAGTVFPPETTEVEVTVQNAFDPAVPDDQPIRVAYCASQDPDQADCPADAAQWDSVPQTSNDAADTTSFTLTGLQRNQSWSIRACALRPSGQCGAADTTSFTISDAQTVVTPSCGCGTAGGGAGWGVGTAFGLLALLQVRRRLRPRAP